MKLVKLASFLLCFALLAGCTTSRPVSTTISDALNTVCTITIYDPLNRPADKAMADTIALLRDIDRRMSAVSDASELTAVAMAAGKDYAEVSPDTYALLEKALDFCASSNGAFDITIRPLVELWGIGTEHERVPEPREIADALKLVDFKDVSLKDGGVKLARPGMKLDLGGIAKGYAGDLFFDIMRENGIKSATADLGGNVCVWGVKPDGSPWNIGVRTPIAGEGGYFAILKVSDCAIVTSGPYERFFTRGDQTYHHIMDPATGYPTDNGLLSVTIMARSSAEADALSTACYVMGIEKALDYFARFEDTEAVFVTADLKVIATPGIRDSFTITDSRFTLIETP